MFDDDADDTRSRAEQGKKNELFRDLFMSIKMEIANDANAGSLSTTVRISASDLEFVEPLVARLEDEGRTVKFDDDKNRLHIDSSSVSE